MKHYRFELGYPYVATECIKYSDVNACNDKALVEIEVKCSLQDLKAEFKTAGNDIKENKTLCSCFYTSTSDLPSPEK